jgi:hypothetical protein
MKKEKFYHGVARRKNFLEINHGFHGFRKDYADREK